METFKQIYARAVARKSKAAVEARLPRARSAAELAAAPADRYLSAMARALFEAGFSWKVIDTKWPGFEEAFRGFDPRVLLALEDHEVSALEQDTRIVRNAGKIRAVLDNAGFITDIAATHGSFGRWVADWPGDDITGLWAVLKDSGARLGGDTGPRMLRKMGKDTFILSNDVVAALVALGVVTKKPTSKADLRAVQAAFNQWRVESGRELGAISMTLALTVASPSPAEHDA